MTTANVPFRIFDGFLKQHAHESLSSLERELFDLLFPAFQETGNAEDVCNQFKRDPLVAAFSEFIDVMPQDRPRRFAGFDFPRNRYFSVCNNVGGDDSHTLAHELRAYRDPVDVGMVEVVDLANGITIVIKLKSASNPRPLWLS
jgi:hypothetical protein